MFLHSAWIFHPEAHVAPINFTKPPVISICSARLASTQELTGVCRRAAASALSAKTAIFHRAVSGVTGSLSEAPHTPRLPLPSLCLGLNLPRDSERADMTSEPHCHTQGISAVDETVTSPTIAHMSSVVTRQERFVGMVLMAATQPC